MENTVDKPENVIQFPRQNYALFNDDIRKVLKTQVLNTSDVSDQTADQVITTVESAICTYLVSAVRKFAAGIADRVYKNLYE